MGALAQHARDIRAAHAAGGDPNQRVAGLDRRFWNIFDPDIARLVHDGSFHSEFLC